MPFRTTATIVAIALAGSYCVIPALGGPNPKSATAVRTAVRPSIDGVPNEPVWQTASSIGDFLQFNPSEGAPATYRTDVRILYDDDAMYVAATMFDDEASRIVARLARRDEEVESDGFSIRFDSYHDHQTAYEFTVNAAGVKVDILEYDDGAREDESWDAVWDADVTVGDDRWSLEMRIPFSVLRFPDADELEWGMQIIRWISRTQEEDQWTLVRRAESGWVSRFGHLRGITGVRSSAALEVLPYALLQSSTLAPTDERAVIKTTGVNAGVDLKFRPFGGITVDATVNPDFGQVEADPAVLNLSTFETFYPDKRPFFVEGVQILRFTTFGDGTGPGLFYSRRIGRSLTVDAPEDGYVEAEPRFASIIGAAKISGKTAGGMSIGVLEAVTGEERGRVVDANGVRSNPRVEPLTNFSLVRVRQDFSGNSNAGLILTSVNREDRTPAMTGGLDWNMRFLDNMYRVDGFYGYSSTSLRGFKEDGAAGKISLNKDGGVHWRWFGGLDFTSRHYNINDIGFFRRPNDYGLTAQLLYRDDTVDDWKRVWTARIFHHKRLNFDGAELINSIETEWYVRLLGYWEVSLSGSADFGKYDDRETRGLGLFRKSPSKRVGLNVETDRREDVVVDLSIDFERDDRNFTASRFEVELEVKPTSALTVEIALAHEREDKRLSWVRNDTNSAISPDRFSIFAERTTSSWDLTSRGSFVFTRDLSVQWYLQAFVAKGWFADPLRRTGENSYISYSTAVSEFTDLSFNSNLVVRWEYRPGSALFLVWSHARSGPGGPFVRALGEDIGDTFRLMPDNVFLMKLTYWIGT